MYTGADIARQRSCNCLRREARAKYLPIVNKNWDTRTVDEAILTIKVIKLAYYSCICEEDVRLKSRTEGQSTRKHPLLVQGVVLVTP